MHGRSSAPSCQTLQTQRCMACKQWGCTLKPVPCAQPNSPSAPAHSPPRRGCPAGAAPRRTGRSGRRWAGRCPRRRTSCQTRRGCGGGTGVAVCGELVGMRGRWAPPFAQWLGRSGVRGASGGGATATRGAPVAKHRVENADDVVGDAAVAAGGAGGAGGRRGRAGGVTVLCSGGAGLGLGLRSRGHPGTG